jgi:hypothetical protein
MRGRIVLFVVLAVVLALVGVYVGWSTNTPKAVGEPATATPANASVGSTQYRGSGSGPERSPTGSPKGSAGQGSPSKDSATNSSAPKNGANQAGTSTPSRNTSAPPPSSKPQPSPGPVRFGQVTTAGRPNDTAIADDRRALTTSFEDFEVIANPASAEPSVTKSFSMTLPLTDGAEGKTLKVTAQGFALTDDGATARLTLRGGRRTIIKGFAPGSDGPHLETLELPATPGRTYQLSAVIEIHKDAAGEGDGYLNAATLDVVIS